MKPCQIVTGVLINETAVKAMDRIQKKITIAWQIAGIGASKTEQKVFLLL